MAYRTGEQRALEAERKRKARIAAQTETATQQSERAIVKFITKGPDFAIYQNMDKLGEHADIMHAMIDIVGFGVYPQQIDDTLADFKQMNRQLRMKLAPLYNIYYATRFFAKTKQYDLHNFIDEENMKYDRREIEGTAYRDMLVHTDDNLPDEDIATTCIRVVNHLYETRNIEPPSKGPLPPLITEQKCDLDEWLKKIGYGNRPKQRVQYTKPKQAIPSQYPLYDNLVKNGPMRAAHAPRPPSKQPTQLDSAVAHLTNDEYSEAVAAKAHTIAANPQTQIGAVLAMDLVLLAYNLNITIQYNLPKYMRDISDATLANAVESAYTWDPIPYAQNIVRAACTILLHAAKYPRESYPPEDVPVWSTTMLPYKTYLQRFQNYRPASPPLDGYMQQERIDEYERWCTENAYNPVIQDKETEEREKRLADDDTSSTDSDNPDYKAQRQYDSDDDLVDN